MNSSQFNTVNETEVLDELSIAQGLGAVGRGIGAVASVPQGIGRAIKQGYKSGVKAIGGDGGKPQAAAQAPAAGAQAGGGGAGNTAELEAQLKQAEQTVASLKSQLQAAKQQGSGASTQQVSTQSTAQTQAAPAGGKATGGSVAGAFKDAEAAMKAGVGMGTNGQSLMQTGKKSDDSVTIKDAQGQEHSYKKVGQQWFDKDNKPVNAAQAAMLDKQSRQQSALGKDTTKPAAAQEPVKIGGQTLDPNNPADKKIIDQVQAQQGGSQPPEQAAQPNTTSTQEPQGTAPAQGQQSTEQPAQAQSPEEIRKAKQAAAGKAAQDQMAANPAMPAGQAAVWKNNRASAGTPAATSPQAAAQATPAQPAAKAHTGGKVAGQVSQTPNAIRKRDARAAAAARKAAPNDVMARMAKQLAPATPAATPNFGQQQPGYASVKMNAPTANVPQQPAVQPTTGAKAVPAQQPAAEPTASAQADTGKPGFLQSKIKGSQVPAKQPDMAGIDYSAVLLRKMKQRV